MNADARAVIAGIGQGGQVSRGGQVQRGQGVDAGGGDVVHRTGLHGRDPQREPVRGEHGLDVAAVAVGLAEYHRSMTWPFTLTAGSLHRSQGMTFPSRILGESLVLGAFQGLVQVIPEGAGAGQGLGMSLFLPFPAGFLARDGGAGVKGGAPCWTNDP